MKKEMIRWLGLAEDAELYIPTQDPSCILFVLDGDRFVPQIMSLWSENTKARLPVFVSLSGENRLAEYTPWPAEALTDHTPAFPGEGKAYALALSQLAAALTERFSQKELALLGYSLGGLEAVYTSFVTDAFRRIISISGSFWFPGWDEFICNNQPVCKDTAYLMLCGRNEGVGKTNIQAEAFPRTQLTQRMLCNYTRNFPLIADEGGHHENMSTRIVQAIQCLGK